MAEGTEGSGLAKGNRPQQNASRTPSRNDAPSALERVRQAAKGDKKLRFTALLHHIYNLETLRLAYFSLKKEAAAGVDGETWRHYGEELGTNLRDLAERLKRGAYRAKPVRRVYIPKADGRQRPLGSRRWKTRSSSAQRSKSWAPSTRPTSKASATALGPARARTTRSMPWRWV